MYCTARVPRVKDLIRVVTLQRHSYGIWLSDVPRGLWCRLLRQLYGWLPLTSYGPYRGHI